MSMPASPQLVNADLGTQITKTTWMGVAWPVVLRNTMTATPQAGSQFSLLVARHRSAQGDLLAERRFPVENIKSRTTDQRDADPGDRIRPIAP